MLKEIRLKLILEELDKSDYVKISTLQELLGCTEMTIWRDLKTLSDKGLINRIHGGAKRINTKVQPTDILYTQHVLKNLDKKRVIAHKAANLIVENDIIFISAGSTNELIADYLSAKNFRIVTNSATIYRQYYDNPDVDALLIGGKYHKRQGSFLGPIANDVLSNMNFTKAFMGTNGISQNKCSASNDEEGVLYRIVLNNAVQKYVLCDTSKFNKEAFYNFYSCDKLTAIITDEGHIEHRALYEGYTTLL